MAQRAPGVHDEPERSGAVHSELSDQTVPGPACCPGPATRTRRRAVAARVARPGCAAPGATRTSTPPSRGGVQQRQVRQGCLPGAGRDAGPTFELAAQLHGHLLPGDRIRREAHLQTTNKRVAREVVVVIENAGRDRADLGPPQRADLPRPRCGASRDSCAFRNDSSRQYVPFPPAAGTSARHGPIRRRRSRVRPV